MQVQLEASERTGKLPSTLIKAMNDICLATQDPGDLRPFAKAERSRQSAPAGWIVCQLSDQQNANFARLFCLLALIMVMILSGSAQAWTNLNICNKGDVDLFVAYVDYAGMSDPCLSGWFSLKTGSCYTDRTETISREYGFAVNLNNRRGYFVDKTNGFDRQGAATLCFGNENRSILNQSNHTFCINYDNTMSRSGSISKLLTCQTNWLPIKFSWAIRSDVRYDGSPNSYAPNHGIQRESKQVGQTGVFAKKFLHIA